MKYERFWDIHLTANNGYYDFAHQVQTQVDYQMGQQADVGRAAVNLVSPAARAGVVQSVTKTQGLPDTGVVASVVKLGSMDCADGDGTGWSSETADLLWWVSDPEHVGKIRLNAHAKDGKIGMGKGPGRKYQEANALKFPLWLFDNGLDAQAGNVARTSNPKKGLLTIAMAVCSGGAQSASLNVVQQVADMLTLRGHVGISVTSSPWQGAVVDSLTIYLPRYIENVEEDISYQLSDEPHSYDAFDKDSLVGAADECIQKLSPEGRAYILNRFGIFMGHNDGAPLSWQLKKKTEIQLRSLLCVINLTNEACTKYASSYTGLKPGQWITDRPTQRQGLLRPPVPTKWTKVGSTPDSKVSRVTRSLDGLG